MNTDLELIFYPAAKLVLTSLNAQPLHLYFPKRKNRQCNFRFYLRVTASWSVITEQAGTKVELLVFVCLFKVAVKRLPLQELCLLFQQIRIYLAASEREIKCTDS